MIFIDFQVSSVFSPMHDVAYFLYMVSPKEGFSHFQELMEFYHKELSSSLEELGSDVNKLFPISIMWEHWNKYKYFGFITVCGILGVFYSEETINTDNFAENVNDLFSKSIKNKNEYLERLTNIVEHFLNYKINN